jgi:mRNA interferase RelE/StbE
MPHTVEVLPRADRFLRGIRDRKLYSRLRSAIDSLESHPRPHGCVKLSGSDDIFRLRVGDYRIIYRVEDARLVVLVIEIGHRREVYR